MKKLAIFMILVVALSACNKRQLRDMTEEEITEAILNDKFYTPARSLSEVHGPAKRVTTVTRPAKTRSTDGNHGRNTEVKPGTQEAYSNNDRTPQRINNDREYETKSSFDDSGAFVESNTYIIDNSIMNVANIVNVYVNNVDVYNDNSQVYNDNRQEYNDNRLVYNYDSFEYSPVEFVEVVNTFVNHPTAKVDTKVDDRDRVTSCNILIKEDDVDALMSLDIKCTWGDKEIEKIECSTKEYLWIITYVYNECGYLLETTFTEYSGDEVSTLRISYTYLKFDTHFNWIEREADIESTVNGVTYGFCVLQTREIEYYDVDDDYIYVVVEEEGDEGEDEVDPHDYSREISEEMCRNIIVEYSEAIATGDMPEIRRLVTRAYYKHANPDGMSDEDISRYLRKINKHKREELIERYHDCKVEWVNQSGESYLVTLNFTDNRIKSFRLRREDGLLKIDEIYRIQDR